MTYYLAQTDDSVGMLTLIRFDDYQLNIASLLAYLELGTALPRSGGEKVYVGFLLLTSYTSYD
jgi:hypothetical protein